MIAVTEMISSRSPSIFDAKNLLESQQPTLEHQFRVLALSLAELAQNFGVEVTPFTDASLPIFSGLDFESKKIAVERLKTYAETCHSVVKDGGDPRSSKTIVWRAIRDFKFVPPIDLFSIIEDDDVIEFYNLENTQIFRNFQFFKVCSYTLEELYSIPWNVLFKRSEGVITDKILEILSNLIQNRIKKVFRTDLGHQLIHEVSSIRRYTLSAEVKYLAAFFDRHDQPMAVVAVEKARLV